MNLKLRRPLLGILGAFTACGAIFGFASINGDSANLVKAQTLPDGYTRLESLDQVNIGDSYVLGIADADGVSEAFSSGTSSWGKMSANPNEWKEWSIHLQGDGSFKASTYIDDTEYYLTVPTSNGWSLNVNSDAANSTLVLGTTASSDDDKDDRPYAIANKSNTARHLSKNGTSGIRSYNNSTGQLVFFYEAGFLPTLSKLEISGEFKTNYFEGDCLDLNGMIVTAYYEDQSSKVLASSDYSVSPNYTSSLKVSDTEFVVTYRYGGENHSASYPINVRERSLLSIEVATMPAKLNYVVGQSFDSTGIVVNGTFEGNVISDITADCEFNPTVFETSGLQTVTVKHKPTGMETTIEVNVDERAVKTLSLIGKKSGFDSGSNFTLGDDASLTAKWNDGFEETLTLGTPGVTVELLPTIDSRPGTGVTIDDSYVLDTSNDGFYVLIGYLGVYANKYKISVREVIDVTEGVFRLVSNVEDIAVGDTVIIVGSKGGIPYAMSTTQNDNNRGITPVSIADREITLDENANVELVTLTEGSIVGSFALSVSGGYLDVNSEKSNRLTTSSDVDEQTSWTIAFNDSTAVIKSVAYANRAIQINSNSGQDLIATYTSSQLPVSLYKFEKDDADSKAVCDFIDGYMHMDDYGETNEGLCAGEGGYYALAKEALLKLTDEQIELFKTSDEFKTARDRYIAWSVANGDTDPYGETGVSGIVRSPAAEVPEKSIALSAVFGLGFAAIAAGSAFIIRRRREEN